MITVKTKKIVLIILWLVVFVHFIKDITQDILEIPSLLDSIGDLEEDLSHFPQWFEYFYHWLMVNTVIAEILLIILIPKYIFKFISKIEKRVIIFSSIYVIIVFFIAFLLNL